MKEKAEWIAGLERGDDCCIVWGEIMFCWVVWNPSGPRRAIPKLCFWVCEVRTRSGVFDHSQGRSSIARIFQKPQQLATEVHSHDDSPVSVRKKWSCAGVNGKCPIGEMFAEPQEHLQSRSRERVASTEVGNKSWFNTEIMFFCSLCWVMGVWLVLDTRILRGSLRFINFGKEDGVEHGEPQMHKPILVFWISGRKTNKSSFLCCKPADCFWRKRVTCSDTRPLEGHLNRQQMGY